jgi:class 3 adenylate cyclase
MIYILFYFFLYCNADIVLNKVYLSNYSTILNNELIQANSNFYNSITNLNLFILSVYSIYFIKNVIDYKSINNISNALALIYIKYIINLIFCDNMTVSQFEFSRYIMWLFTTPLMLKMYCEVNTIKLQDINIQYHIIPTVINIYIYPFKNTTIYYYFIIVSWLLLLFFMKTLYAKRNKTFTNVYLFIWSIFMLLNIINLSQITNVYNINLYYSFADMISKMMACIIVNDYNERQLTQLKNMDLQSVQFISYMIKNIKKYKNDNAIITHQCNKFIDFTTHYFLVKIPENKIILEQELLKKILPFDFEKEYIENTNTNINVNTKQFNMICVLFTDIVNYTELSKNYDDKIIFELLHTIYTVFDKIIKKYIHLQKIETIGDAYMVVGDIFRNSTNHKVVVKEIILFALDIVKEIKTIKTPNNIPLCIRIGINIGSVSIGILGHEIPRLCVVGNTVNIASRLQSTAEIDTIQLSKHIYEQLEDIVFDIKIEVIPKENVFLKNLGSITTYNIVPIL